jgi:hypothetical protein
MLLVKCPCGCHSTLHSDFFTKRNAYRCPNCQKTLDVGQWTEISAIHKILTDNGFQLHSIPDNSTIDFNFNLNQ